MTTAVFGDASLPWVESENNASVGGNGNDNIETPVADDLEQGMPSETYKSATYSTTFETTWGSDNRAKLQKFNVNPMITAVLLELPTQPSSANDGDAIVPAASVPVPLTFAMADCSAFAVDSGGAVKTRTQTIDGVFLEMIVTTDYAFISPDDCTVLEPLLLDLQRYKDTHTHTHTHTRTCAYNRTRPYAIIKNLPAFCGIPTATATATAVITWLRDDHFFLQHLREFNAMVNTFRLRLLDLIT